MCWCALLRRVGRARRAQGRIARPPSALVLLALSLSSRLSMSSRDGQRDLLYDWHALQASRSPLPAAEARLLDPPPAEARAMPLAPTRKAAPPRSTCLYSEAACSSCVPLSGRKGRASADEVRAHCSSKASFLASLRGGGESYGSSMLWAHKLLTRGVCTGCIDRESWRSTTSKGSARVDLDQVPGPSSPRSHALSRARAPT